MNREIVITDEGGEPQVAILEDRRVVEVFIDRPLAQRTVGNIYKGRVENVLPGMQAAFVDVGLERNAFLFVDDALPDEPVEPDAPPRPTEPLERPLSIADVVHVGQEVVVQIAKEPVGTKGARVTRNLTIPGRFLVLVPTSRHVGVSRRIQDPEERERLRRLAESLRTEPIGVIVRTVATGRSEEELGEDLRRLEAIWAGVRERLRESAAPALVYGDLSLVERILRDRLNENVTRIVVAGRELAADVARYLERTAPEFRPLVEARDADPRSPLFSVFGVEREIERALARRVWLESGGYLVIDQTEAFTAIDVNTGRYVGSTADLQDTVFRTNMEAAREIARQLRLRDIGGIIVVDFIDMEDPEHQRQVVEELVLEARNDHARPNVLGLTQLGLVEMTRKKARQSLADLLTKPCPYCEARGRVLTEDAASRRIRREIEETLAASNAEAILVEAHPSVAALLIGPNGSNLKELERRTGRHVYIRGAESCHVEKMRVVALGDRASVEAAALPVHVGQRLQVTIEEPHAVRPEDGIARLEGYVVDVEEAGRRVGERVTVEVTRVFRTYCRARIVGGGEAAGPSGERPAAGA
ncbi:MAG: Rne/Rng family ribonuclease [Clostridia bacterium]|nr:Rne/Rng family ribonuclease [Clostridia bacterium]